MGLTVGPKLPMDYIPRRREDGRWKRNCHPHLAGRDMRAQGGGAALARPHGITQLGPWSQSHQCCGHGLLTGSRPRNVHCGRRASISLCLSLSLCQSPCFSQTLSLSLTCTLTCTLTHKLTEVPGRKQDPLPRWLERHAASWATGPVSP